MSVNGAVINKVCIDIVQCYRELTLNKVVKIIDYLNCGDIGPSIVRCTRSNHHLVQAASNYFLNSHITEKSL